jgi:ADP-heptose:LPS heptosyltransferase
VNGVAYESQAVHDMMSWMRSPAESICGSLSLRGLAGLLKRARLLISNDSGPYHLANAVGTPSVGLYWCGNVSTFGPVFTSRTALHISWRVHCPVCGVHCMQENCAHRDSFVAEIPAQEVIASSFELFYAAQPEQ